MSYFIFFVLYVFDEFIIFYENLIFSDNRFIINPELPCFIFFKHISAFFGAPYLLIFIIPALVPRNYLFMEN
jgi:hypothetical protein